jgi:translation initiation factor IF-2
LLRSLRTAPRMPWICAEARRRPAGGDRRRQEGDGESNAAAGGRPALGPVAGGGEEHALRLHPRGALRRLDRGEPGVDAPGALRPVVRDPGHGGLGGGDLPLHLRAHQPEPHAGAGRPPRRPGPAGVAAGRARGHAPGGAGDGDRRQDGDGRGARPGAGGAGAGRSPRGGAGAHREVDPGRHPREAAGRRSGGPTGRGGAAPIVEELPAGRSILVWPRIHSTRQARCTPPCRAGCAGPA